MRVARFAVFVYICVLFAAISIPTFAQDSPNLENGFKAYGSYDATKVDVINLSNGNLILRIPLPFSYSQRGGKLDTPYYLIQNSKTWQVQNTPLKTGIFYYWSYGWRGLVSTALTTTNGVSFQRTYVTQTDGSGNVTAYDTNYSLTTWDGAGHELAFVPGGFESIDLSGFRVVSSNPDMYGVQSTFVVTDGKGRVYQGSQFHNLAPCVRDNGGGLPGATTTITCQQITGFATLTDANGNYIQSGLDTLGREMSPTGSSSISTSGCVSSLPLSSATIETFTGPTGASEQVKLCFGTLTFLTSFAQSGVTESQSTGSGGTKTINPLVTLFLPNNTKWTFNYDTYGNITSIGFPTGDSISYTWTTSHFPDCSSSNTLSSRSVASRTLTDGGNSYEWIYSWGTVQSDGSLTNVVTDPLGNDSVHVFHSIGGSCNFFETSTLSYHGSKSTGQLLERVDTTYSGTTLNINSNTANGAGNVVPTAIVTTDSLSGKISQTLKSYDPGFGTGFPIFGNPTVEKVYDWGSGASGPLLRETDTTYLFQNDGRYLTANLVDLPASVITKDGAGNRVAETDYAYDDTSRLVSSGITTQHSAAPNPAPVRGNQTSVSKWLNTGTTIVSYTNWYDTGEAYQQIDPLTHTTTYSYSGTFAGAYPTTVTNALSQASTFNYDLSTGLLISATDPNLSQSSFSYDSMFRVSQANRPDGGQTTITRQETTFPFTATLTSKINSSLSKAETNVFDGLGRVKQHQLSDNSQGTIYTDTTYDALGRVATISNPYRTGTDITTTTGITTYGYDALDRKITETYADGAVLSTAYCGPSTLVTDPTGKWRRSRTDGLGLLVEVDEPNAPGASVASTGCPGTGESIWVTSYTNNTLGSLTQVVQNGTHQRTFTYDSLSRMLTSNNPEVGTITYAYNSDGTLFTKKDARAITTTYSYDALHRELTRGYSNADPTVTTTYDQTACLGLSACQNIGHRTSMIDAAGSEAWSYQIDGTNMRSVHREQRTTTGSPSNVTKTATYYLDLASNVTQIVYPTGRTVNYSYDSVDRPSTAIDSANGITYATGFKTTPGSTCLANVTCYTPQGTFYALSIGQASSFTNGLNLTHIYNSRLQPQEFKVSSTAGNAIDVTYNFVDPVTTKNAGHVNAITNNLDGTRSQSFTYDQLNRITGALTNSTYSTSPTHCWGEAYGVDPWGNLQSIAATTNSSYTGCSQESGFSKPADGNNHLSGFSYDASGNTSSDGVYSYIWDGESQLTSGGGVNYLYDGDGRRVAKVGSKLYWYGSGGEILAETDTAGNTQNEYVFFGGKRIAQVPATGNPIYYVEDLLGTSRVLTTASGTVCYDADFYPYGGERSYTNTCPQNYKFEGKERDTETGNDDFGARYYSNRFGRWLSADWSSVPAPVPYANLTNPQTLNLYSMVSDDPESFADLDGHDIKYADGLKNAQLVQDTVQAILANPNTSSSLSGYVGANSPTLTIQSGDLSKGDTVTKNPDGTVTTTTVQGETAPDIQTTKFNNDPPQTTLNGATVTIDNRTSKGDTSGVLVHESVHAGEAKTDPAKFSKDAAAEKSLPHDQRPQEQSANAAQKAHTNEIKKAVKQIEKDRKQENQ
jgi:RHS repeat-associated protein